MNTQRWNGPAQLNPIKVVILFFFTAAAVILVPRDVAPPNALLPATWAMGLGILGSVALDITLNGAFAFIESVNVVFAGVLVIILAEPLQFGYIDTLDQDIVQKEFIVIGLFLASVVIGARLPKPALPRRLRRLATKVYSSPQLWRLIIVCFVVGMLNFAIASNFSPTVMMQGLYSARFAAPWSRGALGGWDAFRDFLTNFGYPLPTLCVLLAHQRKNWLFPDVIGGVAFSLIFMTFLGQNGGRRLVIDMIGAALVAFILINRDRMRIRHFVIAVLATLATLVVSDFMLQVRARGVGEAEFTARSDVRVDNNFWSLGETIQAIPDEHPYVGWSNFTFIAVRPIPRVFWPDKPVDPGFDLAAHLGENDVSYSVTAIGESYYSIGLIGVGIGGLVFGWLAAVWSTLLNKHTSIIGFGVYGLGVMALFLGVRSYVELELMSYPVFLWLIWDFMTSPARST